MTTLLAPVLLMASVLGIDECQKCPWYHDYFTIVTMPHLISDADIQTVGADAYRSSTLFGGWYGAWYPDWERTSDFYKQSKVRNGRLFRHSLFYYDAGEVGDFALFFGPDGKIVTDGWHLQDWKGTPPLTMRWFGMEDFFKRESSFAFKTFTAYGLKPFTDPAGKVPDSVYEVLGRRDVDGKLDWNEPGCNFDVTDEQAKKSGMAAA